MTEAPPRSPLQLLDECQRALGHRFQRPQLLKSALTHASRADARVYSNERLEFLGDSVLGLVVCERLYERFPDFLEGDMTKVKSEVVSRKGCAAVSRKLGLDQYLFLGKGMNTETPASVLADVFEALVAAIYLDGGLEAAKRFILEHMAAEIDQVAENAHAGNHKSELQQLAQREYGATPLYLLLDEKGPDHSKCFKVAAVIGSHYFTGAWGRNKKEAEQKAAMNAIHQIQGQELPHPCD